MRFSCKIKAGKMLDFFCLFTSFQNSEPVPFHPSEETRSILLIRCHYVFHTRTSTTPCVLIRCCHYFYRCPTCVISGQGSLVKLVPEPSILTWEPFFLFLLVRYDDVVSPLAFPTPDLESAISPKSSDLSQWDMLSTHSMEAKSC